jgi:hypothetical protein
MANLVQVMRDGLFRTMHGEKLCRTGNVTFNLRDVADLVWLDTRQRGFFGCILKQRTLG